MTVFFAPTAAGPFVNISGKKHSVITTTIAMHCYTLPIPLTFIFLSKSVAPYVKTTNNQDKKILIPISCWKANITEGSVGVLQAVYKSSDGGVTQYGCADVVIVNVLSADANVIRAGLTLTIL